MTIDLREGALALTGACGVDEVEALVNHLEKQPHLPVDLSAATSIHTALWQAILVFRPRLIGSPASSTAAEKVLLGLNVHFDQNTEL